MVPPTTAVPGTVVVRVSTAAPSSAPTAVSLRMMDPFVWTSGWSPPGLGHGVVDEDADSVGKEPDADQAVGVDLVGHSGEVVGQDRDRRESTPAGSGAR